MMTILIVVGVLIVVLAIGYLLLTYAEASLEVKSSPREPMFECPKHGFFRRKHLVKFLDTDYCPICFDEKIHMPLDETIGKF